ncbi:MULTISPECIES: four helix bundle protein [Autumnicola]|uniref:Four helix bundle protein n=2 Tax=Autumnicola TaxID=3160927 RepID=A0ABU3CUR0_9FLAO|nr:MULTISPECIES: four helix bundle protein [unclassified Zunongwangia]MDT0650100.1 four helix bundle protein [Zunongwangia sp. F297]MDT0687529.1 four helix bundle protein [Zunongwangia sp. F225]
MERENAIRKKSFLFSVKVVTLYKFLVSTKKEFVMSKQLLRSGTAIGALVREAEQAESRADFIHKLSIALKEANETEYWLDLLKATEYLNQEQYEESQKDIKEILKLLIAIVKKMKQK